MFEKRKKKLEERIKEVEDNFKKKREDWEARADTFDAQIENYCWKWNQLMNHKDLFQLEAIHIPFPFILKKRLGPKGS